MCICFASCGGKVASPRGETPPGAGCTSSDQCQSGLACEAGACVYQRCNNAPQPDAWCAEKLGVMASEAQCERGSGECIRLLGGSGEACGADDQCIFGFVCEQQQCQDTCTSSASCRVQGESCVARASGGVKTCQPTPSCLEQPDPRAFCAAEFGLLSEEVECAPDGICAPIKNTTGFPCRFDMQCTQEICERQRCTAPCEDDSTCRFGEVCSRRLGEANQKVCQTATCRDADSPDEFCAEQEGPGSRCNLFGECESFELSYGVFVLIEDITTGAECESSLADVYEPGTDLMYLGAYAGDPEDDSIATARIKYAEQGMLTQPNTLVTYGHLEATLLEERLNPETGCLRDVKVPEPGEVYSMGCGGRMVVSFVDTEGAPVRITQNTELLIGEFEPVCMSGGTRRDRINETFTVSICTDTNAVATGADYSSCTLSMSLTTGYGALVFASYDADF